MAYHDTTARNSSPQLDASQIASEAREIARESLASLFRIWLDIPDCDAQPQAHNVHRLERL
jgi:hypothetical protein